MKKQFILFSTLLLMAFAAKAQKPDMATTMVHYKFSHLRDTTQTVPYTENMILMIGRSATVYKSYDRRQQQALMQKQMQEQMASGSPNVMMRGNPSGSNTEYFQFASEKKLFRKERLINSYIIEEPLPVLSWKISSDTASFGGLHCQKATTTFKGRDYTAWFCPDIPSQSGPWKLSGLPGLIVEAFDAKKQVVFTFDGIEDISKLQASQAPPAMQGPPPSEGGPRLFMIGGMDNSDPRAIQLPPDAVKATEKEFAHLKEAMQKDPNAFAQSAMAAAGANRPGGPQMSIRLMPAPAPPVENNPIELTK